MAASHTLGIRMWPIILTTCALAAIPFWLTGFSFKDHFLTIVVVGGFHRRFVNSNLLRLPPSLSEWLEPRPFRDPNKAFAD